MKSLKICIILLLLIVTLGAVSANEDINDDANENLVEITQNDTYLEIQNTFTDLKNDINASEEILEITIDYKFNNETDDASPILIEKDNFTINGNGHTIDADKKNSIFIITASNVVINNLTFINSAGRVLDIQPQASLTTNNITVKDNYGLLGIIYVNDGEYTSNNDLFIDSTSINYGPITLKDSIFTINNSKMVYSEELDNAFIFSINFNSILITNTTFSNVTAKYNPVLRGGAYDRISILNSKFNNLHATLSGGAIGLKNTVSLTIKNCTFDNITSMKNGGVIFNDVNGNTMGFEGTLTVSNCNFTECYSEFGGNILQLGGTLDIVNSTFENNAAIFDGGAIYTSFANVSVEKSTFISNAALYDSDRGSFGGAIYIDSGNIEAKDTKFINNSAQAGGAVCTYDSSINIMNSFFSNNNDEAIFATFAENVTLTNNDFNNDTYSLNNTDYANIVASTGMELELNNDTITVTKLPSKFDLRDWGWVTSVKNQGNKGSCWTFGICGAIESALLKSTGIYMDFSENNVENNAIAYSIYGNSNFVEEGTQLSGIGYAVSWFGMIPAKDDEYDQYGKISPVYSSNESIHIQDVIFIPPRQNFTDNDLIKNGLIQYGALMVLYLGDSGSESFYNPETYSQYCYDENASANHAVTLVGWDDNYPKEKFLVEAPDDGAWIVKNSWGKNFGDEGYCYVSYYDTTFSTTSASIGFILNNTIPYNNNYQYDIQGYSGIVTKENISYKNIYQAYEDDLIAGIGTYFDENRDYTLKICVNDKIMHTQSGIAPHIGFNTIQLTKYIPVKEGDIFEAIITANSAPLLQKSRQHFQEGASFYDYEGYWEDIGVQGVVASLKVYTVADNSKLQGSNLVMDYNDGSAFKVTVTGWDGKIAGAGETVTFVINGKTYTAKTNSKGVAQLKITNIPKKYTIKASYLGSTLKKSVTVKQVLKSASKTIKKSAKKLVLQATLKTSKGKAIKSKTITFKFNGKTYKAKTNSKGIAKVTIKKNVIKKLKKGKYTVKVTYLKDTIKTTLKVKK